MVPLLTGHLAGGPGVPDEQQPVGRPVGVAGGLASEGLRIRHQVLEVMLPSTVLTESAVDASAQ